jgi:hypothetical protein
LIFLFPRLSQTKIIVKPFIVYSKYLVQWCNFYRQECDFNTQNVIFTRVILHVEWDLFTKSGVSTRTRVIQNVIITCTSMILQADWDFHTHECDFIFSFSFHFYFHFRIQKPLDTFNTQNVIFTRTHKFIRKL